MFHRDMLKNLMERLDLRNVVLTVQDWGGLLGLTLLMEMPERFSGLFIMNTAFATGDVPLAAGLFSTGAPTTRTRRWQWALLARACPHLTFAEAAAYDAPYPDATFKAGVRRFPTWCRTTLMPRARRHSRHARVVCTEWAGKIFRPSARRTRCWAHPSCALWRK
jgi:pimeloyl-ACP methyl ester carboxylesterase